MLVLSNAEAVIASNTAAALNNLVTILFETKSTASMNFEILEHLDLFVGRTHSSFNVLREHFQDGN